jgi:hypothetical protein
MRWRKPVRAQKYLQSRRLQRLLERRFCSSALQTGGFYAARPF